MILVRYCRYPFKYLHSCVYGIWLNRLGLRVQSSSSNSVSPGTLCINQFQRCPSPPGNRGAFAHVASPGGGAFAILSRPRGWALAYPGATPGHLTHAFSKDEFIGKDEAFVKDCPSGTRKTCRCFSKGYYTKSGRLIPTVKRGKEMKQPNICPIFRLEKQTFYGG